MKVDRLALLLLLGLPCASPAAPEVASNRYALVIGIKDYPSSRWRAAQMSAIPTRKCLRIFLSPMLPAHFRTTMSAYF